MLYDSTLDLLFVSEMSSDSTLVLRLVPEMSNDSNFFSNRIVECTPKQYLFFT